jgi:uncharacterized protein YciI
MTVYAVTYHYVADDEAISAHRPAHRAYLTALLEAGTLLTAGPTAGRSTPSALLIFEADSVADVEKLLDADPFSLEGIVTGREIYEWNVVLGSVGGGSGQ